MNFLKKVQGNKEFLQYYGNIIYKDKETNNNVILIWMEYCSKGNLFDILESNNKNSLSENQILQIWMQIISSLTKIHDLGFIHSDIKLENILVNEDYEFKICDYGSLLNMNLNLKNISEKNYNEIINDLEKNTTLMYRPPELIFYNSNFIINHKIDIWMLGCILYTLMFLRHPFFESNKMGIYQGNYTIQNQKYSKKLENLLRNCLTPDPNFRLSSYKIKEILANWKNINNIELNVK